MGPKYLLPATLHLVGILFAAYSVFHIFYFEKVSDSLNNVYENPAPSSIAQEMNHIKFRELSSQYGLDNVHEITPSGDHPRRSIPNFYSKLAPMGQGQGRIPSVAQQRHQLRRKINQLIERSPNKQPKGPAFGGTTILPNAIYISPSISVIDIDKDGFQDIFLTQVKGKKNKLFKNVDGKKFIDVADEYGLSNINTHNHASMAYFVDFNLDGHLDLLLTRWGCHDLYFGQGPGKKFLKKSENLDGYCSFPRGVNFMDFNRDGHLDIVFGNYSIFQNLESLSWEQDGLFIGNKFGGGENMILEGIPGGRFKKRPDLNFLGWRSFTHGVGIFDFNHDGWEDIFFTNDYSTDEVWINKGGKKFVDQTEHYFPKYRHGFSGMNSEVFDIDNDGLFEIYISNTYKPPYRNSVNNLWKRESATKGFSQKSNDLGIGRCGFAWSGKFTDVDNDGNSELMVVNGRTSKENKGSRAHDSFWYYNHEVLLMPRFLRKHRLRSVVNFRRYSSLERNCLFTKRGNKYYDIAPVAGITDVLDGRGLALIDTQNQGQQDFAIANIRGPALFYKNESEKKGNWLGIELVNKSLNQHLIGLKVILQTTSGKQIHRLYNPFHGYRAQSDPRLHFGLGEDIPKKIEINLKSGKKLEFNNLTTNSYNAIVL